MSINLNRYNRINRKKIFNRIEKMTKDGIPQTPVRPPLLHPQIDASALTDIFLSKLTKVSTSYQIIDSLSLIPELILQYAEEKNIEKRLVTNISIEEIKTWPDQLTVTKGPATGEENIGLSYATAAIAETGSLAICSSKQNPTTVNFLTDHHIVILNESDIATNIEQLWEKLQLKAGNMPRAVNIITGPSRTADIEQTIQLGAHGPRGLHVLLLTDKHSLDS